MVHKAPNDPWDRDHNMSGVAVLWAGVGDITAALKFVDLMQFGKDNALSAIVSI